jgi:hypothetical protein
VEKKDIWADEAAPEKPFEPRNLLILMESILDVIKTEREIALEFATIY